MRIVGGKYKGRTLKAPQGRDTRPTSDRTRESAFNILAHASWGQDFEDASVVDVFAGTGALGLEALSRGAAHATFIEADALALKFARENAATLSEWRNVTLLKIDACHPAPPPRAANAPCRFAFFDAPYKQGLTEPALRDFATKGWIEKGGIVVVEIAKDEAFETPRHFTLQDERTYGAAKVLFLTYTG